MFNCFKCVSCIEDSDCVPQLNFLPLNPYRIFQNENLGKSISGIQQTASNLPCPYSLRRIAPLKSLHESILDLEQRVGTLGNSHTELKSGNVYGGEDISNRMRIEEGGRSGRDNSELLSRLREVETFPRQKQRAPTEMESHNKEETFLKTSLENLNPNRKEEVSNKDGIATSFVQDRDYIIPMDLVKDPPEVKYCSHCHSLAEDVRSDENERLSEQYETKESSKVNRNVKSLNVKTHLRAQRNKNDSEKLSESGDKGEKGIVNFVTRTERRFLNTETGNMNLIQPNSFVMNNSMKDDRKSVDDDNCTLCKAMGKEVKNKKYIENKLNKQMNTIDPNCEFCLREYNLIRNDHSHTAHENEFNKRNHEKISGKKDKESKEGDDSIERRPEDCIRKIKDLLDKIEPTTKTFKYVTHDNDIITSRRTKYDASGDDYEKTPIKLNTARHTDRKFIENEDERTTRNNGKRIENSRRKHSERDGKISKDRENENRKNTKYRDNDVDRGTKRNDVNNNERFYDRRNSIERSRHTSRQNDDDDEEEEDKIKDRKKKKTTKNEHKKQRDKKHERHNRSGKKHIRNKQDDEIDGDLENSSMISAETSGDTDDSVQQKAKNMKFILLEKIKAQNEEALNIDDKGGYANDDDDDGNEIEEDFKNDDKFDDYDESGNNEEEFESQIDLAPSNTKKNIKELYNTEDEYEENSIEKMKKRLGFLIEIPLHAATKFFSIVKANFSHLNLAEQHDTIILSLLFIIIVLLIGVYLTLKQFDHSDKEWLDLIDSDAKLEWVSMNLNEKKKASWAHMGNQQTYCYQEIQKNDLITGPCYSEILKDLYLPNRSYNDSSEMSLIPLEFGDDERNTRKILQGKRISGRSSVKNSDKK